MRSRTISFLSLSTRNSKTITLNEIPGRKRVPSNNNNHDNNILNLTIYPLSSTRKQVIILK